MNALSDSLARRIGRAGRLGAGQVPALDVFDPVRIVHRPFLLRRSSAASSLDSARVTRMIVHYRPAHRDRSRSRPTGGIGRSPIYAQRVTARRQRGAVRRRCRAQSNDDAARPVEDSASGAIRVGIGGWVFPPWRSNFYPEGLAQKNELEYASRQLTAIEINATYHRLQKPASFAKWRDATPPGFVFSVKGSQYVTNRRVLGEAGEAIGRFMASGLAELGPKLGPIVWQFATDQGLRSRRLRGLPEAAAGEARGPAAAPRGRGAPSELHDARVPGAGAPARRRHGLRRFGQVPVVRRRRAAISSMPG